MANELIEEKTKRTPKQKVWFGVRIALNVVFYAIILLVLLFSISNIRAKNENDKIPNVFGLGYLNVLSDSMDGDFKDSFKAGDMIIVKTASKKNIAKLEVGDIVTFLDYNLASNKGASTALNTHRIVYIDKEANIFYTVGDKAMKLSNGFDITTLNDENCLTTLQQTFGLNGFQAFGSSEIRGIYSSKWTGFGSVIQTINNHFVAIIIVPIAILLVLELGYLIYNIMKVREEKLKKDLKPEADLVMTDDDKEKLKAELRAQLLAEMGVSAPTTEVSEESLEAESNDQTQEEPKEDSQTNEESESLEAPAVEEVTETQSEETINEPTVEALPVEEPVAEAKEETNESKEEAIEAPKPKKAPAKKTTTTKKTSTSTAAKKTTTTKKTTVKKAEATTEKAEAETTEAPVKKTTTKKTATSSAKKADSPAKKTTTKKAASTTAKKTTTTKKTTTAKKSDSNE